MYMYIYIYIYIYTYGCFKSHQRLSGLRVRPLQVTGGKTSTSRANTGQSGQEDSLSQKHRKTR